MDMANQPREDENLVPLVLTDSSAEHSYAAKPPQAAPVAEFSSNIDIADLLGLGQDNGLVPSEDLMSPNDWLISMYDSSDLSNEVCLTTEPAKAIAPAPGLTNDPFLTPSNAFMKDLQTTMSHSGGSDSDLATWLEDLMHQDTLQAVPTPLVSPPPVSSHGSPSSASDNGYDSHGSISSPGSASSDGEPFVPQASLSARPPPYTAYEEEPTVTETLVRGAASPPSASSTSRRSRPQITFEELERTVLSGPTAFSSSAQVSWQPGEFQLTPDEIEALQIEKLPIPTSLPLTGPEEKALKHVRRKLKNKIAAQESRRKKKEYVEGLEKRIVVCTSNNGELQKKVKSLEDENKTLLQQLMELQKQVEQSFSMMQSNPPQRDVNNFARQPGFSASSSSRSSMRVTLLVLAVCFALVLPFTPGMRHFNLFSHHHMRPATTQPTSAPPPAATPYDYTVTKFRSRVLLHTPDSAAALTAPPLEGTEAPSQATREAEAPLPTSLPPLAHGRPTSRPNFGRPHLVEE